MTHKRNALVPSVRTQRCFPHHLRYTGTIPCTGMLSCYLCGVVIDPTTKKETKMGTRGAMGVRIGGQDKITYNHFDSYPDALGQDIIKATAAMLVDRPVFTAKALTLAPIAKDASGNDLPPTPEQIEKLKPFADTGVSAQSLEDWYCLLRKAQGDLEKTVDAGFFSDSADFLKDSLFCEYAYIVNLDDDAVEFYIGFQKTPHDKGRYAQLDVKADEQKLKTKGRDSSEPDGYAYYPVALVGTIPFDQITSNPGNAITTMMAMYRDLEKQEEAA